MPQDHYFVLGIPADASQADIKGAYRRLAKEFHPDHYKGNDQPFQAIQEAYTVLSDPDLRRRHDGGIQNRKPGPGKPIFSENLEPLVSDQFCDTFSRHAPYRRFQQYQPFSGQRIIIRFKMDL